MPTSEEECLAALRAAALQLGKSPTKAEYEELGLRPASRTILRVFEGWNDAKEAAGLETFDQSDGGGVAVGPKPESVRIPHGMAWEELTAQQRWYYKNRNHRISVKEARRQDIREWYIRLKRDEMACERCGEQRPPALDLHHEDEKERDVSEMVNDGYSRRRIQEEIDRCTVLCANCHRRKHYEGPDPASLPPRSDIESALSEVPEHEARRRRREWLLVYKQESDGCDECTTSAAPCLDFHHETDKIIRIGKMVAFGHTLGEIRNEIEKCTLLCGNCHRQRHFERSGN